MTLCHWNYKVNKHCHYTFSGGKTVRFIQNTCRKRGDPILLSVDNMNRLGLYLQNLDNALIHRDTGNQSQIICHGGHPFVQWDAQVQTNFTFNKLQSLHQHSRHPHVDKLFNQLTRGNLKEVN